MCKITIEQDNRNREKKRKRGRERAKDKEKKENCRSSGTQTKRNGIKSKMEKVSLFMRCCNACIYVCIWNELCCWNPSHKLHIRSICVSICGAQSVFMFFFLYFFVPDIMSFDSMIWLHSRAPKTSTITYTSNIPSICAIL